MPDNLLNQWWDELARGLASAIEVEKQDLSIPVPLGQFVREAWHVVEPHTPFVDGWHIDAICRHLERVTFGDIRKLLITMPPRHMKSLLVSVFWPAWVWTFRPWARWLCSSYAGGLSMRDSVKTRRLIMSPWYTNQFGAAFALTGDQNVKTRFENNQSGYRIATSVGGVGTGEGGDVVAVDDPHKVREVESDVERTAVVEWWDQEMSTRLNDPQRGAHVIVMQRIHELDLAGHVLKSGDYIHLNLPAEFEEKRRCVTPFWEDPRTHEGELLWPARFPQVEIDALKKTLGSYGAAGQLQQRPAPATGGIFKRHWWKHYTVLPDGMNQWLISWDMAFKDLETSSYVVGQVWARKGADLYLVDQIRDHLDFTQTLRAVTLLAARWPKARLKLVEDKANGPAVVNSLRNRVPGLVSEPVKGSKEARAAAVSPYVEAGNVHLPLPEVASWVGEFIDEHASFPKGANDDQVDALSQALLRMSAWRRMPDQGTVKWG
jgi:predicted phage terminase large subunit-like protein